MVTCPPDPVCEDEKVDEKEEEEDGDDAEEEIKCEIDICASGQSGNVVVPFSDCSQYVQCSMGVPGTIQNCPEGQMYSERIMACNIISQVTCPPDPTCPPSASPTLTPTLSAMPTFVNSTAPSEAPSGRQKIKNSAVIAAGGGVITSETLEGMYVMDAHIAANKILIARELLTSVSPSSGKRTPSPFSYNGFKESLHTMITMSVDGHTFYIGEANSNNGRVYGLVNIAAFLSQSVVDSIQHGSCDEVNSDIVGGVLPISNACGQNGMSYNDMTCPAGEEKYACQVDDTMRVEGVASTLDDEDKPRAFYCGPSSDYDGYTGSWDYVSGTESRDGPVENALGKTDVQG